MVAVPKGSAAYKKKDGILTVSGDQQSVIWTPLPGTGPPVVSLAVSSISNLQQTPDNAPKVMLKLFEKAVGSNDEPATYLFHFNSTGDPRGEANSVRDLLSRLITEARTLDPSMPRLLGSEGGNAPGGNTSSYGDTAGPSAAISFASTVNARRGAGATWWSDEQLKADIALQQSLINKDRALHQIYMDARETKPEAVSDALFNLQFWSARVDLLRAYAIETHQKKGAYNVLSAVKPRTVDGELKLNINVEQVQLIFQQHPLVKRIYDESVPKLSENDFWSRFFLSRLSKRLRGERVTEVDNSDPLFDRYNPEEDTVAFASKIMALQHVPHIIDLEGNEENQGGFKSGNRKDVEMRPRANIPIVQTLNSLSEKIMANVAPSDPDPASGPVEEADEATYQEQLALRDLQGPAAEDHIVLNAREQSRFFSSQGDSSDSDAASKLYAAQSAADVLFDVHADLETLQDDGAGGIDLHVAIGIDDDSDSDEDDGQRANQQHVGSRAARKEAQTQILDGFARQRAELYGHDSDDTSPMGIPASLTKRCYLTNATTTEFLKQFWNAFLSGDPDRAQELAYHSESLKRSVQRIEAIAADAEQARAQAIKQKRQEILDHFNRTGRRLKWKPESVKGGKEAVLALLAPTIAALKYAQDLYTKALKAEGITTSTEA